MREGINVADVLREVPLRRRDLENRFRKILGFTPYEEIVRVRIDRVKQCRGETDRPMMRIAQLTGFRHVEYMSTRAELLSVRQVIQPSRHVPNVLLGPITDDVATGQIKVIPGLAVFQQDAPLTGS
jgi:AraC-like DNA-binding protein